MNSLISKANYANTCEANTKLSVYGNKHIICSALLRRKLNYFAADLAGQHTNQAYQANQYFNLISFFTLRIK